MEATDCVTQILGRLNRWLSERGVRFTGSNVLFVRDDAVRYMTETRRVPDGQTATAERFPEAFASLLAGGPSWIHANATPLGDRFLITLAAGQKIGSPCPSINVSYEPDKQAEIVPEKALVTAN